MKNSFIFKFLVHSILDTKGSESTAPVGNVAAYVLFLLPIVVSFTNTVKGILTTLDTNITTLLK